MNNIDHPQHYNHGTIEVIDVIEDWKLGFHLGNAVKYIGRAGHKGNAAEDIKKAIWYLERHLQTIENADPVSISIPANTASAVRQAVEANIANIDRRMRGAENVR